MVLLPRWKFHCLVSDVNGSWKQLFVFLTTTSTKSWHENERKISCFVDMKTARETTSALSANKNIWPLGKQFSHLHGRNSDVCHSVPASKYSLWRKNKCLYLFTPESAGPLLLVRQSDLATMDNFSETFTAKCYFLVDTGKIRRNKNVVAILNINAKTTGEWPFWIWTSDWKYKRIRGSTIFIFPCNSGDERHNARSLESLRSFVFCCLFDGKIDLSKKSLFQLNQQQAGADVLNTVVSVEPDKLLHWTGRPICMGFGALLERNELGTFSVYTWKVLLEQLTSAKNVSPCKDKICILCLCITTWTRQLSACWCAWLQWSYDPDWCPTLLRCHTRIHRPATTVKWLEIPNTLSKINIQE